MELALERATWLEAISFSANASSLRNVLGSAFGSHRNCPPYRPDHTELAWLPFVVADAANAAVGVHYRNLTPSCRGTLLES